MSETSAYEHVHPDYRYVFGLPDEERKLFMEANHWVGHREAQKVLDTFQGLMVKPPQTRMPNLLFTGEPNHGKTRIVERFLELHGESYINEDNEPVKPAIMVESPSKASEKELYIQILRCFHPPFRDSDTRSNLHDQVVHLCRTCHVRLLILDEIHSVLTGSGRGQREVMNTLKQLMNELRIPIVGVGTTDAVRVLHLDPQHASRFDVVQLPLWQKDREFQRFLKSFERILPLKVASELHQPQLAELLHAMSGGNTGNLRRILTEAGKEAIQSGQEYIDKRLIENQSWIQPQRGIRERPL